MPARATEADSSATGAQRAGERATARAGAGAVKAPAQGEPVLGAAAAGAGARQKSLTISKIRYLEDQKLLAPRRTPGGYRLYTQGDLARLRTILRMQRDEFLPLRVIRQELAAGRSPDATPAPARGGRDGMRVWRPSVSVRAATGALFSLDDVLDDTKAEADLVRELEEYGVIKGEVRGGVRYFDETEREIVAAVAELARYGVGGRNLRVFRSSADREANLLQQILAPALRSRSTWPIPAAPMVMR